MSELTPCNYCSLRRMRDDAERRGTSIVVEVVDTGDMAGWTSARYANEPEPSAWFAELSDHCVC